MLIRQAYAEKVKRSGLSQDSDQLRVVEAMQDLQERLADGEALYRRMLAAVHLGKANQFRGLYLWGGVGRGKTFLMDLFFQTLPIRRKRRIHFHRMMSEVHRRFRDCKDVEDPLDRVAADIAREAKVLCFDEFFVSDIGDAMILARILQGLFRRGVVLIATSNTAPRDLYHGGLQRERFLPAISLLEEHAEVMHIGGTTDYRLRLMQQAGTYLSSAGPGADEKLRSFFDDIASGDVQQNVSLSILDRTILTRAVSKGIAWFDFKALCHGPRSQQDYIEIARWFPTVIISNIPTLTSDQDDAVRRFISLVDEFYDRRVKLIMSAEADIADLYRGSRLAGDFRRTASRLNGMQTEEYLHLEHLS